MISTQEKRKRRVKISVAEPVDFFRFRFLKVKIFFPVPVPAPIPPKFTGSGSATLVNKQFLAIINTPEIMEKWGKNDVYDAVVAECHSPAVCCLWLETEW